jgi:hypothetical protein
MRQITVLLLLFGRCAGAQTDNNANGWYMYFGDHPIGKTRWGIHLEGQWRRTNLGLTWQQLLLRPAVNYQLNKKVMLTSGYGFVDWHRYGDYPAKEEFMEHRAFEQVAITQKFLGLDWQNRLRLEQRNILGYAARYENRFRYMLRTNIPLKFGDNKQYVGVYDEIMYNFGKNVAANVFDQNRAYIALGRDIGHQTKLEAGFMEQTVQQRSGRVYEHNHTLSIAIYSKLPFGR